MSQNLLAEKPKKLLAIQLIPTLDKTYKPPISSQLTPLANLVFTGLTAGDLPTHEPLLW